MKLVSSLFNRLLKEKQLLYSVFCLLVGQVAFSQQTITGKVTDDKGIPIAGVAVVEKSTTKRYNNRL